MDKRTDCGRTGNLGNVGLVLDHLFIITEPGAVAAQALLEAGFVEGTPNIHPGQGTSCRRFFFVNTMLELLYLRDAAEAEGGRASRFRFPDRSRVDGACPFGFVYRHRPEQAAPQPFPAWEYQPDYLPDSQVMQVGDNSSDLHEPLAVILPEMARYTGPPQPKNEQSLTRVSLSIPVAHPSVVVQAMCQDALFDVQLGEEHLLELHFDDHDAGLSHDFRPAIPLLMHC